MCGHVERMQNRRTPKQISTGNNGSKMEKMKTTQKWRKG
jgi:hypothetical protein